MGRLLDANSGCMHSQTVDRLAGDYGTMFARVMGSRKKGCSLLSRLALPLDCIGLWPRTGNSGVASDYDAAPGRIQVTSGVITKVRSDAFLRRI